jgi:hypothetical protein
MPDALRSCAESRSNEALTDQNAVQPNAVASSDVECCRHLVFSRALASEDLRTCFPELILGFSGKKGGGSVGALGNPEASC